MQSELLENDSHSIIVDSMNWGPLLAAFGECNFEVFFHLVVKYRFNLMKELFLDPDTDRGEQTAA